MRLKPSPSMAVALTALVLATTGTAVAAVSYATNAGAVDGKSAVADDTSLATTAGRLVATQRSGDERGRIDQKYLDDDLMRGKTATFGRTQEVADNQKLAPVAIGSVPGLGGLSAQCIDQNAAAGVEDPLSHVVFANTSGDTINVSRTIGNGAAQIVALAPNTTNEFDIAGSNTFELHVERKGVNSFVRGVVRQDGRGSASASCLTYGFSLGI